MIHHDLSPESQCAGSLTLTSVTDTRVPLSIYRCDTCGWSNGEQVRRQCGAMKRLSRRIQMSTANDFAVRESAAREWKTLADSQRKKSDPNPEARAPVPVPEAPAEKSLWACLSAGFPEDQVRTRPQGGRQLPYITARTVMNRLDEVLGPANWWDKYMPIENGVICELTIRFPDGSTLTKSDAGGCAGMADAGDDEKSAFSDAFKRAAVKFGVGRYLYGDGVPRADRRAKWSKW
jgi:Rad52/22 family double-strand break repair protein